MIDHELKDRIDKRLAALYPEATLDWSTYTAYKEKCRFTDCDYGSWMAKPDMILKGSKHPKRATRQYSDARLKKAIDGMPARMAKLRIKYPQLLSIDISTFKGTEHRCRFVDSEYGEWWTIAASVFRGCRHPKRSKRESADKYYSLPIATLKERIRLVWGNDVTLDETSVGNAKTKVRLIKASGESFEIRPDSIIRLMKAKGLKVKLKGPGGLIIPIEEVKKRIREQHGNDIAIDEATYQGTSYDATFIHAVYGRWTAKVRAILDGHSHPAGANAVREETNLRNTGYRHVMQNPTIFRKAKVGRSKRIKLVHWKTGEEVSCQGSFEWAVVSRLNQDRVDFKWQIPFEMSIGDKVRTYFVDLYLPERDTYVEIKGYFIRENARLKWETFHLMHPNSELWLEDRVYAFTGFREHTILKAFKEAFVRAEAA